MRMCPDTAKRQESDMKVMEAEEEMRTRWRKIRSGVHRPAGIFVPCDQLLPLCRCGSKNPRRQRKCHDRFRPLHQCHLQMMKAFTTPAQLATILQCNFLLFWRDSLSCWIIQMNLIWPLYQATFDGFSRALRKKRSLRIDCIYMQAHSHC